MTQRAAAEALTRALIATLEAHDENPGLKTIAALMLAAEYARRTAMPSFLAARMLTDMMAGLIPRD